MGRRCFRDRESTSEVAPERDAEFGACLGKAEEIVTAVAAGIASCAAADLTPGNLGSNSSLDARTPDRAYFDHPPQAAAA